MRSRSIDFPCGRRSRDAAQPVRSTLPMMAIHLVIEVAVFATCCIGSAIAVFTLL